MAQTSSRPLNEANVPLQKVLNVWDRIRVNSPVYEFLLSNVDIYHAEQGLFSARLQVGPRHLNSKGGLHGSFSATVTDWAGGLAIASHGLESTGVSTNINVNYLSSARTGDWLEIQGRVDRLGKTLAFTSVAISSGGTLVAQGSHTKYIKSR
ncbi:HotDog domain-containing protein [Aspergillus karnatakaensis]|uniref:PaaI family thioesterase n=1 Tax=Aspergillus karnatakaensis TaxID=1810916 RepID=UPI003CCDE6FC